MADYYKVYGVVIVILEDITYYNIIFIEEMKVE